MNKPLLSLLVCATALSSAPARAQFEIASRISIAPIVSFQPTWKCKRWDGTTCTRADLANPWYRQIVILPTGFEDTASDRAAFWTEFDALYQKASNAGSVWTTQKRNQLLYVGYFVAGGALNTPAATFGGAVAPHPIRAYALSMSDQAVYAQIETLRTTAIPELKPMGVGVLFNTFQDGITASTLSPSMARRTFGVSHFTRQQLAKSAYIAPHELAHAALNFVDEHVEPGLDNQNIHIFDNLTPLLLLDGSWGGFADAIPDLYNVYDYSLSEILANNGNVNVSTSAYPATVYTPGYPQQSFVYEGGMSFGRGTWHMAGNNLMDGGSVVRGPGDEFAYAHSPAQQQVIETAFGAGAQRPNDRLRTAGPKNGWPLSYGSTTTVMMFDGDKHNHVHPTQKYIVEVGWYERNWKTCWSGFVPYTCYEDVWTTAQKSVYPSERGMHLRWSMLSSLGSLAQQTFCALGVTEIPKPDGTPFKVCESDLSTIASVFLPTQWLRVPYQTTTVPASQWFTTYYWRFKTWNGTVESGFTGWSSFYRSL